MKKKKKKENRASLSHSNLSIEEGRSALKDPNVYVPKANESKTAK